MRSDRSFLLLASLLAAVVLPLSNLFAISIAGRVSDTEGTPIAGAQVIAQSPDSPGQAVVVTREDGTFSFESLPAGSYTVTVRRPGFGDLVQPDVKVAEGGQSPRFDFTLRSNRQQAAGPGLDEQDAEPQLQWGDADRSGDRDVTIPVLFAPHPNDPVGDIHAEVTVPSGPWQFERAEAAPQSEWKVSARQKQESDEAAIIELSVSSSGVQLPKGLIGYLRFRLDDGESLLPSGLTIGKLETFPPAIEVVEHPSPGVRPGLSGDPSFFPCCWGE